jgi:hypothetical protein
VGLAVLHTLIAVRVSYAQKHFSTALSEKNKGTADVSAQMGLQERASTDDEAVQL